MKVLKSGVEVHKVRIDVVRKEYRISHALIGVFLNLFGKEMSAGNGGLKGSRDAAQLKRRRRKKAEKSSRQKNRNGKKR